MEVLIILFGVISIIVSLFALYQSEKFNFETKRINDETKSMIEANERSISNLHISLREVVSKDSIRLKTDGISIIKLQSYNISYSKNIMFEISKLYKVLNTESMNKIEKWMSSKNDSIEIDLNKELSRQDYDDMEYIFEKVRSYGVWITVNIEGYNNIEQVG